MMHMPCMHEERGVKPITKTRNQEKKKLPISILLLGVPDVVRFHKLDQILRERCPGVDARTDKGEGGQSAEEAKVLRRRGDPTDMIS